MKMAKASERDNEDFDSENTKHCYRAMKEVLGIVRGGSIGRVIWGMYVMLDPANKVVDPDADTLEDHPETVAAIKDAERYRSLRRGQKWSVVNGIGDTLRGEALDVAIDEATSETPNVKVTGSPALSTSPRGLPGSAARIQGDKAWNSISTRKFE